MKIYISVDLEGVNKVVKPEQVLQGNLDYEEIRKLATDEVNAAIAGAKEGGAKKVVVNDSHDKKTNIDLTKLDPDVELISGEGNKYSMVHGADETFDAAIFIGYHAKAGTPYAIMDHSFYPKIIQDIKVNDISFGEIGLNMLYLAEKKVPVIMVSGDEAACKEALAINPSCKTACVKKAQGRFSAKCLPINKGLKLIKNTAKNAVLNLHNIKTIKVPQNPILEMKFSSTNLADAANMVPGTKRKDVMSVQYSCKNIDELYMWRQVFSILAFDAFCDTY